MKLLKFIQVAMLVVSFLFTENLLFCSEHGRLNRVVPLSSNAPEADVITAQPVTPNQNNARFYEKGERISCSPLVLDGRIIAGSARGVAKCNLVEHGGEFYRVETTSTSPFIWISLLGRDDSDRTIIQEPSPHVAPELKECCCGLYWIVAREVRQ